MIVCFSGGLDSFIAWLYLGKPKAIFCKLGSKYEFKELNTVLKLRDIAGIDLILDDSLRLGQFEQGENAYIPNRNLLIGAIASNYDDDICIAGVKGDDVEDKNPEAFRVMSNCLTKISKGRKIRIFSPFWNMSKEEIVAWYIDKNFPVEWLNISISCYNSTVLNQCGECPSCFRKAIALEYNGVEFVSACDLWKWTGIKGYIDRMKRGEYDKHRTRVTLDVLEKKGVID